MINISVYFDWEFTSQTVVPCIVQLIGQVVLLDPQSGQSFLFGIAEIDQNLFQFGNLFLLKKYFNQYKISKSKINFNFNSSMFEQHTINLPNLKCMS